MKTYIHPSGKINVDKELTQEQIESLAKAMQHDFGKEGEIVQADDEPGTDCFNWVKQIIR